MLRACEAWGEKGLLFIQPSRHYRSPARVSRSQASSALVDGAENPCYNGIIVLDRHALKGEKTMPTQDERIMALEQTTQEYRPVLQNFAYEVALVKGLIVDQTGITQELRRDMYEVKQLICLLV